MARILNKDYFKDDSRRGRKSFNHLSSLTELLSLISRVMIFIFFTPILVVSGFFTKELFLSIANISLALGQFATLIYSYFSNNNDDVGADDLLVAVLSIIALYTMMFYVTGGIVGSMLLMRKTMFIVNTIAASVNTYFLVKDIVSPPAKYLLNSIFNALNIKPFSAKNQDTIFDVNGDSSKIRNILKTSFGYTEEAVANIKQKVNAARVAKISNTITPEQDKLLNDIDKINQIVKEIRNCLNKCYSSPFGAFIYQEKIKILKQALTKVVSSSDLTEAIRYLEKKCEQKRDKLEEIAEVRAIIAAPAHSQYDQKLLQVFTNMPLARGQSKESGEESLTVQLDNYKTQVEQTRDRISAALVTKPTGSK